MIEIVKIIRCDVCGRDTKDLQDKGAGSLEFSGSSKVEGGEKTRSQCKCWRDLCVDCYLELGKILDDFEKFQPKVYSENEEKGKK